MNYANLYAGFLKKYLKPKKKMKVVFDCSNGTTGRVVKKVNVKSGKLEVILMNDTPDGNFPAHGPNPLLKGAASELEKRVKKEKADLGVIFDADGDRVFFVDNRGRFIDANEIGFALMQMFRPPFVVSEISSWRLKRVRGAVVSAVGHYFFKTMMRKKKASLGLEHSGHFYFKDFSYCDSGIFAAIAVINFVSGLSGGFAGWLDALPKYCRSGEINFSVADKKKILDRLEKAYGKKADRISRLDGLTMEFTNYWFNVRPSNTENLLRLNVEAVSPGALKKVLKEIRLIIAA